MNTAAELKKWHEYITPQGLSKDELLALYDNLILEETKELRHATSFSNMIKEAADLAIVVAGWLYHYGRYDLVETALNEGLDKAEVGIDEWSDVGCNLSDLLNSCGMMQDQGISYNDAIGIVTKSNMTKFVLQHEIAENFTHFTFELGIAIDMVELEPNLFAIYSSDDQTDNNGKEYTANKLLKPKGYKSIDESTEWWKV